MWSPFAGDPSKEILLQRNLVLEIQSTVSFISLLPAATLPYLTNKAGTLAGFVRIDSC